MTRIASLATLFTLSTLATTAFAGTYYVSPTGSDTSAGSQLQPWQSMRKGLTSLRAGDTLVVRGGVYQEMLGGAYPIRIYPGTSVAPVNVVAYPGERVTVQGLLWLSSPSYWTIDGINVTWQDGQSPRHHMVKLTNGVGWTYKNAEIWGAKSYAGVLVAGTVANEPNNWTFSHNSVHDTLPTNDTNQDHCIYVNTGMDAGSGVIERNLFFNALNGNGIKLGGADNTQGSVNVTVRYNTVYNTTQSILVAWKSSNNSIYRNILKRTATNYANIRSYQLTGTGNVARDNFGHEAKGMFMSDSGYSSVADGGGNIFGIDPLFDALQYGDFHPYEPIAQPYGVYADQPTSDPISDPISDPTSDPIAAPITEPITDPTHPKKSPPTKRNSLA